MNCFPSSNINHHSISYPCCLCMYVAVTQRWHRHRKINNWCLPHVPLLRLRPWAQVVQLVPDVHAVQPAGQSTHVPLIVTVRAGQEATGQVCSSVCMRVVMTCQGRARFVSAEVHPGQNQLLMRCRACCFAVSLLCSLLCAFVTGQK